MQGLSLLLGYCMFLNLAGFFLMLADKRRAVKRQWRIRERSFFLVAAFGGSIGCMAGMYRFRHKTRHKRFVYGMPLLFLLQAALAVFLIQI